MRRKKLTVGVCALVISMVIAGLSLPSEATGKFAKMPAAGAAVDMGEGSSYVDVQASIESIMKDNKSYATGTSSVGLETIENNVSVVRVSSVAETEETAKTVVSSEAAVAETETSSIQPVTVATVQEVSSEAVSEEQTSVTPEVVKADTVTESMSEVAVVTEDANVGATASENTEVAEEAVEIIPTEELEIPGENVAVKEEVPAEFQNLVIAQVNDYVNVRAEASTEAEIVGKLYDESVGTLVEEKDGWYQITSGNVTGYVKAEFCVTGEEAVALAEEVGTQIATVNTTTLKVRTEANIESSVMGLVPLGEELVVVKEEEPTEGWVKISIEEGEGYVSTEYVSLRTDFVKAESKEEEAQRLAQEAAARAKHNALHSRPFQTVQIILLQYR